MPGRISAAEEPRIGAWSLKLFSAELVREAHSTFAKVPIGLVGQLRRITGKANNRVDEHRKQYGVRGITSRPEKPFCGGSIPTRASDLLLFVVCDPPGQVDHPSSTRSTSFRRNRATIIRSPR
jgi:hypothetical protein